MSRLERLMKMLEADASDAFVLYGIAQEHARAGKHAEAIGFYDRCLAADAGYSYAYYHKAVAQQAAGDEAGARRTLEAGLAAAERVGDAKAAGEIGAMLDGMA